MTSTPGKREDSKISCPHDGQVMEKICLQGNLYVDRCAACGCMWFDAHEIERVVKLDGAVDLVDRKVDTPGRQTWITGELCCPRDKTPLIHVMDTQQQHVEMHTCGRCSGILLDRGELQDLAEFTIKERVISVFRKIAKK